jgi:diacylglycerol kinase (ATP)
MRLWKALFFSLSGLRDAWREPAFRLEVTAFAFAVPIAVWLPVTRLERVLLIASVGAVIAVELVNSAIEKVVDRIGVERHELSRVAKDMGSAAVLVAILISGGMWIALAGPALVAIWR